MQKTKDWRNVLGVILRDPQERQRVAHDLNVSSFTLQRWIRGEAKPHIQQLHQLVQALPEHQRVLQPLIVEEFEAVGYRASEQIEEIEEIKEIPSIFYAQVLRGSTTIPAAIRFWSLVSMILQQALMQLDPQRNGLLLRVARFLPPGVDGKLHCLREVVILGTSPWDGNLSHTAILLGAESLAGQAVAAGRSMVVDTRDRGELGSIAGREAEMSMLAFPITRGNGMAGVLQISSVQKGYFTPYRLSLSHRYTDLLTLAFESEDFYEPKQLELAVMPTPSEQAYQLSTFRQRVATLLMQETQRQPPKGARPVVAMQAELQVWQQFAEEFLQRSA